MPEYSFECRRCTEVFELVMRVSERLTATIRCPACGSGDMEPRLQPFFAKTAKKS